MAKNVTLTDENDEVIYPETKTENIFHGDKKLKDELDNTPKLNAENTFTGKNTFENNVTINGEYLFADKIASNESDEIIIDTPFRAYEDNKLGNILLEPGEGRYIQFSDGTKMSSIPKLFELTEQKVRVWDLSPGSYLWTYEGTKHLLFNGSTAGDFISVGGTGSCILNIQYQLSRKTWHITTSDYNGWYIYYGYTTASSGVQSRKNIGSLMTRLPTYASSPDKGITIGGWEAYLSTFGSEVTLVAFDKDFESKFNQKMILTFDVSCIHNSSPFYPESAHVILFCYEGEWHSIITTTNHSSTATESTSNNEIVTNLILVVYKDTTMPSRYAVGLHADDDSMSVWVTNLTWNNISPFTVQTLGTPSMALDGHELSAQPIYGKYK